MKSILFLGGSHGQLPAIRYAKKQGYRIILIDYLPNNPGKKYADIYYSDSTTDIERVFFIAQKENIDAVIAYASDPAAYTAAYISEKLNLVGSPAKSVLELSDKYLFRQLQKRLGLNVPLFFLLDSFDFFVEIIKRHIGKKFILKPVDSSGSKDVMIIDSPDDLQGAFFESLKFSRSNKLILEEYIPKKGPQIHGEAFVENGKLKTLTLGDQFFDRKTGIIPYSTIVPSLFYPDIENIVWNDIQKIIKETGFITGGLNIELIISEDDKIFILEIGPRSGGNFMPNLIAQYTGFDITKASIDVLFNLPVDYSTTHREGHFAQIILHSYAHGRLNKIHIPAEFSVLEKFIYYNSGDKISEYRNSRDVIGVLIGKLTRAFNNYLEYQSWLHNQKFVELV